MLSVSLVLSQNITVAFRHPYLWSFQEDSVLNELREVLKQEKVTEVQYHANYRIYIMPSEQKITVYPSFKIKVEKNNITVTAPNDMGLINGVIDIVEQLKKTRSLAKIKSKVSTPKETQMNKAIVLLSDSSLIVRFSKFSDYKIWGYKNPDSTSKKLILISDFTNDVKDNPYQCPYGAYYETNDMDGMEIKFISKTKNFITAQLVKANEVLTVLYIEKRMIEFIP